MFSLETASERRDLAPADSRQILNGIDVASQILKRCADTSVILLSMHSDEDYVIRGT